MKEITTKNSNPMKTLILLLIPVALFSQVNPKSERVHTYTRRSGRTVQSYQRTSPNHKTKDNYSHKGNTNPYTGKGGRSKK